MIKQHNNTLQNHLTATTASVAYIIMSYYYVCPFIRPSECLYRDSCVSLRTLYYYIASTEEPIWRRIIDQISYIILYLYVRGTRAHTATLQREIIPKI